MEWFFLLTIWGLSHHDADEAGMNTVWGYHLSLPIVDFAWALEIYRKSERCGGPSAVFVVYLALSSARVVYQSSPPELSRVIVAPPEPSPQSLPAPATPAPSASLIGSLQRLTVCPSRGFARQPSNKPGWVERSNLLWPQFLQVTLLQSFGSGQSFE